MILEKMAEKGCDVEVEKIRFRNVLAYLLVMSKRKGREKHKKLCSGKSGALHVPPVEANWGDFPKWEELL